MLFQIAPIPNLLVLAVPFTIIVVLVSFIRGAAFLKTGPKIPPGPHGRDQAKYLQTDRWNVFKAWNEKYGRSAPVAAVWRKG
jgi:hypothetical protein